MKKLKHGLIILGSIAFIWTLAACNKSSGASGNSGTSGNAVPATKAGVDTDALAKKLQEEGAASFEKSWNDLMTVIKSKSAAMRKAS